MQAIRLLHSHVMPVPYKYVFITKLLHNFMFVAIAPTCFGLESRTSSGSYKPFQCIQHIWHASSFIRSGRIKKTLLSGQNNTKCYNTPQKIIRKCRN
jgi:hypothetical protein